MDALSTSHIQFGPLNFRSIKGLENQTSFVAVYFVLQQEF